MQQHKQHTLKAVVHENSTNAYNLSAQMIELAVVQSAVAGLLEHIDEITHKGWHEDRGMAYVSILEIQDTVRLIDMAFYPLFKNISEEVISLNSHAEELYQTVIKSESEQSAVAASNI